MKTLRGILPAVVTPFDDQGKFNPSAFERLLERLYGAGAHGVYVCGQTGEGSLQSPDERRRVTEAAVKCSPRGKIVVAHVGAAATVDAIELAKHAARAGAGAISSLPPVGNYSFAEVRAYYQILAEASELPLLIYFFPAVSSAITTSAQILELCSIPNIVGLKFTDHDLFKLATVKAGGATVFNGYDEVLVAGLLMGADGGIGTFYNLVPELFVSVYDLARAERWSEAHRVQQRINELISITIRYPLFPAVKEMLSWSGIDCGRCLLPRQPLTAAEASRLRADLARSNLNETFASALPKG